MGLRGRLIASFVTVSLFILAVGGIGIVSHRQSSLQYEHVAEESLPNAQSLNAMRGMAREVLTLLLHLTLPGNSDAELVRVEKKLLAAIDKYHETATEFDRVHRDDDEVVLAQQVKADWANLEKSILSSLAFARSRTTSDQQRFADLYRGEFHKVRLAYFASVDALLKHQTADAGIHVDSARKTAANSVLWILALSAIGFLSALALGVLISRKLSLSLQRLAAHVGERADQVAQSASGISHASLSLSDSVSQQASAIHQTTATASQLMNMVERSAQNAAQSSQLSQTSEQRTLEGKKSSNNMIQAMVEIHEANSQIATAVGSSNQSLKDVVKIINTISEKTRVINDIVFQTKLLSFNASVEAARAGESGKGFAVVAEEVGNLARMSGEAASQIHSLLSESVAHVEKLAQDTQQQIGSLMQIGVERIEQGKAIAGDCGQILGDVADNAGEVSRYVGEIASASQEQTRGIQEINKAISMLNDVTQQNSSAAHQTASSAAELLQEADGLKHTVSELKRIIWGGSSQTATSISPLLKTEPPQGLSRKAA